MKAWKIDYNWQDNFSYKTLQIGLGNVRDIIEHPAAGEGDKWFYDVLFEDGTVIRIFNPNSVYYK